MSYCLFKYVFFFLPLTIFIYQATPRKYRPVVLLQINYLFFILISKQLVLYLIGATIVCFLFANWMNYIDKKTTLSKIEKTNKKKTVLVCAIVLFVGVLFVLKYSDFFLEITTQCVLKLGIEITYSAYKFLVPIGISYYTLQIISYLTDIVRGQKRHDGNIIRLALYLSFFPQIMEGPISRYDEVALDLYEGKSINNDHVKKGYQRILWGLFKKYLIADRVAVGVGVIFGDYKSFDGIVILIGAILYTVQLYMEFSGCMDIAIGSGEIFGIRMPENFRQPFFAKNASDFWHRWHITLGTWFKDYVFYPVSMSPLVKKMGKSIRKKYGSNLAAIIVSMIALFCVWILNGLWHGPKLTYVFYGIYYFVIISLEMIFELPFKKLYQKYGIDDAYLPLKIIRFAKLCVIVVIGELFFRADSLKIGLEMVCKIIMDFNASSITTQILNVGIDLCDWLAVVIGLLIVIAVGVVREQGINIRDSINQMRLPIRWTVWYAMMLMVLICGAYGSEYSSVAMIYAGF